MAEWVAAVAAALSIVGAVFAWWHEHKSKTAKRAAEAAQEASRRAEAAAQEHLESVREQVEALRRLAEAAEGPPLVAERDSDSVWQLRNTSRASITIEAIVNKSQFLQLDGLVMPLTLPPGAAHEFLTFGAFGHPVPATLTLRVAGRSDDLHVPLRR